MKSSTIEMYERFKDAPWFTQSDILVGGGGGIGSWLCLLLARCGHNIFLFDMDTVELQNMGGQLYAKDHVGKLKTLAIKDVCGRFANNLAVEDMGRYDENSMTGDIVFTCFDNMAGRKLMAEKWFEYQKQKAINRKGAPVPLDEFNIFIDGRMEAETAILYAIKSPSDYKRYQAELFEDSEVPNAPCSFRATSHNPAILAGLMVSVFNNFVSNKKYGKAIREVPFKMTYELPTLTFSVEP